MDINKIYLQHACSGFTKGDYTTLSAAARAWDVSRHTLRTRLHRIPCKRISHENQQRLTNVQERLFVG